MSSLQCLPVLLVDPPQVSVQTWLAMEGVLAATNGAAILLGLTVDGLDVHQQVVPHTEATPTLLALEGERS